MFTASRHRPSEGSASGQDPVSFTTLEGARLVAEIDLRSAGRALEWLGVVDPEAARLARVVFRLANRVRTDRLETAA